MKYVLTFLGFFVLAHLYGQISPVNRNATAEAKNLLDYIYSLDGNILSGQHSFNEEPTKFYDIAKEISGKYPSVWGTDFYWNRMDDPGDRVVRTAIKKHEEGAIVTLMWHVGRPMDSAPYEWENSVQNKISDEDWEELVTTGTELHRKWLGQIDNIAGYLKKLQKAHIPVLWRPYHEMNGVWFWWGNRPGKNGFQKLWKLIYERFVEYHKLNNLIWVWNANGPRDIPDDEAFSYKDFYPGDEYVDVLATDIYHFDYEQKDYEELLELAKGKPIALGEVGELPNLNILEAQPKWSWFMIWSDFVEKANYEERVIEVYNADKTISRDKVKMTLKESNER